MDDQSVATDGSRHRRFSLAVRWLVAYGITVLMLAAALWSVSSPVRPELAEWFTYLVCAAIGAAWVIGFLVAFSLKRVRVQSRGVFLWLAMPALVVACVAVIAEEVPASVRFSLSRQALERAADRAQSGHPVEPGFIGLTPVSDVKVETDGTTLFFVYDAGWQSECGFAFNPRRTPDLSAEPNDSLGGEPIDVGWWLFCEG